LVNRNAIGGPIVHLKWPLLSSISIIDLLTAIEEFVFGVLVCFQCVASFTLASIFDFSAL